VHQQGLLLLLPATPAISCSVHFTFLSLSLSLSPSPSLPLSPLSLPWPPLPPCVLLPSPLCLLPLPNPRRSTQICMASAVKPPGFTCSRGKSLFSRWVFQFWLPFQIPLPSLAAFFFCYFGLFENVKKWRECNVM